MRDERLGDGEPVVPGQLHVEQHDVRTEVAGRDEGAGAVDGLAHDVEPVGDQQHVGQRPERRVVVDDEHPHSHAPMLAAARRTHHRANPAGVPGAARYCRAAHAGQFRTTVPDRGAGMSAIVAWTRRHRLVAFFGSPSSCPGGRGRSTRSAWLPPRSSPAARWLRRSSSSASRRAGPATGIWARG